jgi:trypsin
MKVSALLLAHLLASAADARLFSTRERTQEKETKDIDRIINGVEAEEDRYGYTVTLQDNQGHLCGASLIAKDMLVSAAHCAGGRYDAIIGRHKHNDKDGDVVRVASEYKHQNYNDATTSYDFMVLKLSRATTANATPVKINSSGSTPQDDENLVVMGWGVTNENSGTTSNKLMEVTVQAVSNSECRSAYGGELNTSTMLCAAGNRKDSCQGDSGGPLIKKGGNPANDLLVGIVSWGYGCADPDYPGVYARVSAGYSFIQQVVCQESEDSEAREAYNCGSVSSASLIDPSGASSGSSTSGSGSSGNWASSQYDDFFYDDDDDDWSSGSFQGGGFGGSGNRPPQGSGSGGSGMGGFGGGGGSGNRPPQGPGSGGSSFGGSSFGSFASGDDGWFDDDGNYDDWGFDDDYMYDDDGNFYDDWPQGSSTSSGGRPGQGNGGGWWSGSWNTMSSWWNKLWH